MPLVALWFFAMAPIYVLVGMGLGIVMGATADFSLAPAHAHLNLLGWVTMALYGTFYALAKDASRKLAWTTFWLNNVGVTILFPSLVMVLRGGEQSPFVAPMILGELLVFAAMACFAISVWQSLLRNMKSESAKAVAHAA